MRSGFIIVVVQSLSLALGTSFQRWSKSQKNNEQYVTWMNETEKVRVSTDLGSVWCKQLRSPNCEIASHCFQHQILSPELILQTTQILNNCGIFRRCLCCDQSYVGINVENNRLVNCCHDVLYVRQQLVTGRIQNLIRELLLAHVTYQVRFQQIF